MDPQTNLNPNQPGGLPPSAPANQQDHLAQYAVTPTMQAKQALPAIDAAIPQSGGLPGQAPSLLPGQSAIPGQTGKSSPMAAQPKSNPNSTQNTLLISEIRDGIVIMNDGSFRSVIMCKTINFDLMSPEEREAVEYSYQSFVNSLYFPVQIYIKSMKVDMRPYLERLDKIRNEHDNMLLALLMEDYLNFMVALTEQTNIMDKKFYLVIPYFPPNSTAQTVQKSKTFVSNIFGFNKKRETVVIDELTLETAKTELRNQVQAVLNGLTQIGVQSLPLDTQELIELYYGVYNPDTAPREHMAGLSDLTVPIVTKGKGEAQQPSLNNNLGQ